MAVGNLNLYDILVDLVPGTFFIILLTPLIRLDSISIGQGIGLLLISYVVGRLIHAIGSLSFMSRIRLYLEDIVLGDYLHNREHGLSFRQRLMNYYNDEEEFGYTESEHESDVIEHTISQLENKISGENDANIKDDKIQSHKELRESSPLEPTDNLLTLRYYGENYLFDKDTLYLQYEITSTFYRSLWTVSSLGILIYTIALLNSIFVICGIQILTLENVVVLEIVPILAMIIVLLVVSYLSLRQRIKFRFKKTRAFINDLHINLQNEQD